jgi:hypothetical protein
MAKPLTRDEVQSIVKETNTKVVLQPAEIDNLYNDLNVALLGMGFYTKLEGVNPKQAVQALKEFKQGLAKVKSQRHIIEPLLTSLLFRQVLKPALSPSTCSRDCVKKVEDFFRAVKGLPDLTKTGLNEVKCILPAHARPGQLIRSDLPKIYRAYFRAKCGSGEGPGARFIVAVLNKAGIKNQSGSEFTIEGVVKFRDRAAKTSRKRNAKV